MDSIKEKLKEEEYKKFEQMKIASLLKINLPELEVRVDSQIGFSLMDD